MGSDFDVVVIGGGLGGVAATLAAVRLGARVCLVSEDDWIGGQATSQCVPPDEHPWIEQTGCTGHYRQFRARVRDFYRRNYALTAAARDAWYLNPGDGNVGPLCHEPHVAELVLRELLAPWISRARVTLLTAHVAVAVALDGDRVQAVHVRAVDGRERELTARCFLDATDLGDLLELAGVEHVIGAESRDETGEPHALDGPADPLDQQAITWGLLLDWSPETDNVVARPRGYERWRAYEPDFWPGPLFGWEVSDFVTHEPRPRPLFVTEPSPGGVYYDLWHARRIVAREQFEDGTSDVTAALWPMMDYWRLPLVGAGAETAAQAREEAREFTRSFLHWMQTEAPRHDGGEGYPELRPRGDLTGTPDGLARMPYVREGRRIRAEFTILEQHIGVEARPGAEGAEPFFDTVGIGAYRIDLHPTTAGRNTIDIDTWPFQIPLGALLPVRVENLLPAAKNIGTTHLTNGAYRVHPVEWAIGEAAGALAAFSLAERRRPRDVRADRALLERFQQQLADVLDVPLAWPRYAPLTPTTRYGYVPTPSQRDGTLLAAHLAGRRT